MSSTNKGNDYKLNMLLNMGFDNVSKCVQALEISNGDVERAIDFLCQDNAASSADPSSSSMQGGSSGSGSGLPSGGGSGGGRMGRRRRTATPNIVSCELSQYTVPNGKSACTCIALSGAESFLKSMAVSDWKDPVVADKSNDDEEEAKIELNDTKAGFDDGTNDKVGEDVVVNIPSLPPPPQDEEEESKVEDKNQEQNKKERKKDDNDDNNNDDEDDFVVVSAPNSPSIKISSKRLKQNHDQDEGEEEKETDAKKHKEDEEDEVVYVEDDDRPDDPMEIEVVRSCDYEDGENNNDNNAPTEEIQINSGTIQKEEEKKVIPEKNKEEEEATVTTDVASKDEEAAPKEETTTTTTSPQAPPPKRTAEEIISPAFLGQMIMDGVQSYEHFITTTTNNNSIVVEHTSVEDVLSNQKTLYTSLKLIGSVRQGVLSSDTNHELNLSCILKGCREDGMVDEKAWLAIVITKTPETIIVLLPPTTTTATTNEKKPFILLDSHPRPHLTFNNNNSNNKEGSYAAIHASFDALIETLQELFPVTDLGDDVPEMMSVMYNSFDVYPIQLV